MLNKILITGGLGFIGSHTAISFLNAGYEIFIIDNLSNSYLSTLKAIENISNKKVNFIEGDIRDATFLDKVFSENHYLGVIHFAGLKSVAESSIKPLEYYDNNINGTVQILKAMNRANVKRIIFSSSATVYGKPEFLPITENHKTSAINCYGLTKLNIENMLSEISNSDSGWSISVLRYFNPIGAHPSFMIGENPQGIPNNLMPFLTLVASKKIKKLKIFGNNYATHDGTGVRDYIHVVDLAEAHLAAFRHILNECGIDFFNIGTGKGTSVFDLISIFENVNQIKIPYEIVDRRPGDVDESYADVEKARKVLDWKALHNIEQMCRDSWMWHQKINLS